MNQVEQDHSSLGDGLPTYDDLAAQSGPNSRFGRWRNWIEKRAAERYHDLTPEERERRRARGWGNEDDLFEDEDDPEFTQEPELYGQRSTTPLLVIDPLPLPTPLTPKRNGSPAPGAVSPPPHLLNPPPHPHTHAHPQLHIQIHNSSSSLNTPLNLLKPTPPTPPLSPPSSPPRLISQSLLPSHLRLNHFGSRFLPHAPAHVRCVLPLLGDHLLLIGHDEGLSVLDMFPQECGEDGEVLQRGPDEAQARQIWVGEGVFQMSILEIEEGPADGTPQGVVLMLVGPEAEGPGKDQECMRILRMYNLNSLISLARWAVSQKSTRPLDLRRPSNWSAQQTHTLKKHRPQSSIISRSFKSLIEPSPPHSSSIHPAEPTSSYSSLLTPPSSSTTPPAVAAVSPSQYPARGSSLTPNRKNSEGSLTSPDSAWDMVDDLPLRWATDFVPLASSGSRLINTSILSYALWRHDSPDGEDTGTHHGRGGAMLGVATKGGVLLYETPKGERAFRFVKEFYTPMQPRSISFVQQVVPESSKGGEIGLPAPSRFHSGHRHSRSGSNATLRVNEPPRSPRSHSHSKSHSHHISGASTQLSIFVIFEKKAGWIRLADSAAGEVELYDDGGMSKDCAPSTGTLRRSRRASLEALERKGTWVPPVRIELPVISPEGIISRHKNVHLLTRGKTTHVLPCPLPSTVASQPPLRLLTWQSQPTQVIPRLCRPPPDAEGMEGIPFLQLVALGECGVEVQEISLGFLGSSKGKGRAEEIVRAQEDVGGDAGFLCRGGHWDRPQLMPSYLSRSLSTASFVSTQTNGTEDAAERLQREQGIYGWCRKGHEDWRIFWVGGRGDPED